MKLHIAALLFAFVVGCATDTMARGAIMADDEALMLRTIAAYEQQSGSSKKKSLPVFPGAAGFGTATPAGSGRHLSKPYSTIYKVTNLKKSGPGSLLACIKAKGPRTCVFEVSGTIDMTGRVNLKNPYITIAGQTAPSPGIMIKGATFTIRTHDVLIQHIRFRTGDNKKSGVSYKIRDTVQIFSHNGRKANNVVLDHVSMSWGIDEVLDISSGAQNVTISNSIISEGLSKSIHKKGEHSKAIMVMGENITFYRNLIMSHVDRTPRDISPSSVFVNNLLYNTDKGVRIEYMRKNENTKLRKMARRTTYVGNMRIPGPDSNRRDFNQYLARINEYNSKGRVYLAGNRCGAFQNKKWACAEARNSKLLRTKTSKPPVWNGGLKIASLGELEALIRRYVGARPKDRDPVDRRLITELKSKKGQIKDCVERSRCKRNAGGWPKLPQKRRSLKLPSNPNAITSSGYTRLEAWLHQQSKNVQ